MADLRLYTKYDENMNPIAYAFGEPWVEQALIMDDIHHKTVLEAIAAWVKDEEGTANENET